MMGAVLETLWTVITLPFRLIFWVAALLGRAAGLALGFAMMVIGFALSAGPYAVIGIPVFLLGLLLTLRSVG
ncbi:MAG: hypothetical protein P4L84_35900 [Isosphaeraceae bacterium]|nr:hypothetical protein [Isosphaeraceae bacterium]